MSKTTYLMAEFGGCIYQLVIFHLSLKFSQFSLNLKNIVL